MTTEEIEQMKIELANAATKALLRLSLRHSGIDPDEVEWEENGPET